MSGATHRPPKPATDARAAAWIAPRLLTDFGAVGRTVPTGFEAYARILHPADVALRWAEVARRAGTTVHALAQFHRIAGPTSASAAALSDVDAPQLGDLSADQLATLCAILRRHTPGSQQCWFALWEGWGDLNGGSVMLFAASGTPARPRAAPADWQLDLRAATFELPGRRYYLFTGPLDDAGRFGRWMTRDWFVARSPNLFWPDDRSWCVASEIDFDSTLVGGTTDLIADILRSDDLEAWPVTPHDSLAHDGDTINPP